MKKLSIFLILSLLLSTGVIGVISGNWTDLAYIVNNNTGDDGKSSSAPTIKIFVIHGAGYFLKSHADFQLFLNKIELAELNGVDFSELQDILNAAINSMESANTTYYNLKNLAAATPYSLEVIEKLKTFNYYGFLFEKGLNVTVFYKVIGFLIRGDVTGTYDSIFLDSMELLDRLNNIKQDIDNNTIPDISKLWELNQKYSESLFFGQYISMIFKELI